MRHSARPSRPLRCECGGRKFRRGSQALLTGFILSFFFFFFFLLTHFSSSFFFFFFPIHARPQLASGRRRARRRIRRVAGRRQGGIPCVPLDVFVPRVARGRDAREPADADAVRPRRQQEHPAATQRRRRVQVPVLPAPAGRQRCNGPQALSAKC
jgi:hypothetical protein